MTIIAYSDVHEVLMNGDACSGCAYRVFDAGLRRCIIIDAPSDPTFCPGVEDYVKQQRAAGMATADIEDDGFVTVHPDMRKTHD